MSKNELAIRRLPVQAFVLSANDSQTPDVEVTAQQDVKTGKWTVIVEKDGDVWRCPGFYKHDVEEAALLMVSKHWPLDSDYRTKRRYARLRITYVPARRGTVKRMRES